MAILTKALSDDHRRLKWLFGEYDQQPANLELALNITDEIKIHTTLEEELLYPLVEELDPAGAEAAMDEHQVIDELVSGVEDLEAGDPRLQDTMRQIKRLFEEHADDEENNMFPALMRQAEDELYDLGRQAFSRRQELIRDMPQRDATARYGLANTGWSGKIANSGW